jgi:hypothetical protein
MILRNFNFLMNECYERIKSNTPYDKDLKIYKVDYINEVIHYFELREEFEKCKYLKDYLESKLNHDFGYKSHVIII